MLFRSDRLGLFPGASLDRLRVSTDAAELAGARLVQIIGDIEPPAGATLVATDLTAFAHEPIHVVPLVQLHPGDHVAELTELYSAMGMAPRTDEIHPMERWRLGPALVELTNGDTDKAKANCHEGLDDAVDCRLGCPCEAGTTACLPLGCVSGFCGACDPKGKGQCPAGTTCKVGICQ